MARNKRVEEWEVIEHGMMLSDYFSGCGTAFTKFEDVYTGVGDNPRDALADAMEIAGDCGWDFSYVSVEQLSEEPSVSAIEEHTGEDLSDTYYIVSIRLLSFNPNKSRA